MCRPRVRNVHQVTLLLALPLGRREEITGQLVVFEDEHTTFLQSLCFMDRHERYALFVVTEKRFNVLAEGSDVRPRLPTHPARLDTHNLVV